jgi:cation-transporting P-type ATPase C
VYEVASLPGRIRFKSSNLYGDNVLSKYIKLYIDNLYGVSHSKVTSHTCSILVTFDENKINKETLKDDIESALRSAIANNRKDLTVYESYYKALINKQKSKRKVIYFGLVYIGFKIKQSMYGKFSLSRNLRILEAASIVTVVGGYPLLKKIYKRFSKHMPTDSDILLKLSALSFTIMRESTKGIFVLFLKNVADYIKYSADSECMRLFNQSLASNMGLVRLLNDNNEEILISSSSLNTGDKIKVMKGEVVPVEGMIVEGSAVVNSVYHNGQPIITSIEKNMKVQEGLSLVSGEIVVNVTTLPKEYDKADESLNNLSLSKKVKKHQNSAAQFALGSAGLNYLVTGNILTSLSVLLVLSPSASSTAFNSGVKNYFSLLNKNNMYLRNITAFDKVRAVDSIVFDKTGTLTEGIMKIVKIHSFDENYSENDLLKISATCEVNNYHPISITLQKAAGNNFDPEKVKSTVLIPSKGVRSEYEGKIVLIGNKTLMQENNVDITSHMNLYNKYEKDLLLPIFVSIDNNICGLFVLKDHIRKDAEKLIKKLRNNGIDDIYILTGNNDASANATAASLSINNVYSECTYEDKVTVINHLKQNHTVMMVGDGINDALAMKVADVSASFGDSSCDKTKLSSDFIIFNNDISKLADFMSITQQSYSKIYQTLLFSKYYNFTLGAFAFIGYFDPFTAKSLNTLNSLIALLLIQRIKLINPKRLYVPADEGEHLYSGDNGMANLLVNN